MKTNRFVFPMVLILTILVLTFFIPIHVSAQEAKYPWEKQKDDKKNDTNTAFYIAVKPGIYSPQTNDLKDFDTGFNGEIMFGYRPHPNFAAEIGAGYFTSKGKESFAGQVYGISYSATADEQIDVVPVTLTLKGIYPIDKWELFALGGIGAYFVSGELKYKITANGMSISDKGKDSTAIFGGHLGLGFHYNITPRFFVGAEGKYLLTSKATLKGESFGVPLEAKFNLNGIVATAVLGVRF